MQIQITITVDNDILAFARSQAKRDHQTIGQVVSSSARDGIPAQQVPLDNPAAPTCRFALLPARNEIITSKHVRDLMDTQSI